MKSCSSSPPTAAATQTTAATANTVATPLGPFTPSDTISSAAINSVESVNPEIGLFDEPMKPTSDPETVVNRNPVINITTAAIAAIQSSPAK